MSCSTFFHYGESEGRSFFPPNLHNKRKFIGEMMEKKVYFHNLPADNGSYLYRVCFPSANQKNIVTVNYQSKLMDILTFFFSAHTCVFVRPSYDEKTIFLTQLCRVLGVKIIYDFDDLMLPEYTHEKGAIRAGVTEYEPMLNHLVRDSVLLTLADEITCTTEMILNKHLHLNEKITISKNKLPRHFFPDRDKIYQIKTAAPLRKLKILYLSGTITHLKDYSLISGPLLKVAQDHPGKIEINFMGALKDQSETFKLLNVESQYIPYESFETMLKVIGEHDLILVPLETTIFNDAKSNIKFIEAASQGVAIIASPASEFSSTIENGVDGWLCRNEKEWYDKIKKYY